VLGGLSALGALALAASPGCGTEAKGVEDCRQIERARCDAAVPCGIVSDQTKCEIYYRDHCLHGLAVTPPQEAAVDECVKDIQKLGSCAQAAGPDTTPSECGVATYGAVTVCDVIQYPEHAYSCSFLKAPPPEETGGQSGTGGSEG
jgi:hypothetical protein